MWVSGCVVVMAHSWTEDIMVCKISTLVEYCKGEMPFIVCASNRVRVIWVMIAFARECSVLLCFVHYFVRSSRLFQTIGQFL